MASGGGACGSGACGSLPKLPEKPFQPTEIAFPRRPFGRAVWFIVPSRVLGLGSGSGYTMMLAVTRHIALLVWEPFKQVITGLFHVF